VSDASSTHDGAQPAAVAEDAVDSERVLAHPRPPRPGDLSLGWRAVTAGTWIGVVVGLAAIWNASVQLGLSTWWLGPRADPQPRLVQFAPFVAPILMLLATINQVRWLAWCGLATAAVVAGVAVGDVGRVTSLAVIEFAIAGAAALVSVASFTGTYRLARPNPGPPEAAPTS
jgi:hypothetical protein